MAAATQQRGVRGPTGTAAERGGQRARSCPGIRLRFQASLVLRVHHFSAVYSPTIGSISNLIFQKQENCMVTCPEPPRWLGGWNSEPADTSFPG